ncbi:MAG: phosphate acyltransferase PlsX [Nitrincola lacisaponensis]|uniref:phosphate acyltransferase PlsX n=1 Tax=Nitrincola lacisaponensis TaxID=267850 RepID=UPI00391C959B
MSEYLSIAVDAMGGDFGPRITVPACINLLKHHSFIQLQLAGDLAELEPLLAHVPQSLRQRIHVHHTLSVVSMHDKPSHALRHRRDSSMFKAVELVQQGVAAACVSAGNTGALMALGCSLLGTLPGIDRPAIISAIPTQKGHCFLLDLGANVNCTAEQLLQFALMGSAMVSAVEDNPSPRIGLLNIGIEEIKGNDLVRQAARLIQAHSGLNYIGYVEGGEVFSDRADVIVCDGFTGNIALKSNEGLARLIAEKLRKSFTRNLYRRLLGLLAQPVLKELQQQIDPGRRNGASLLGLQGVVVKSHGGAGQSHFEAALNQAVTDACLNIPARITAQLQQQLSGSGD